MQVLIQFAKQACSTQNLTSLVGKEPELGMCNVDLEKAFNQVPRGIL